MGVRLYLLNRPQNYICAVDRESVEMKTAQLLSGVDGAYMYKYVTTDSRASLNALAEANSTSTNQIRQVMDDLSSTAVTLADNVQSVNAKVIEMGDNMSAINSEAVTLNDNSDKMNKAGQDASESMSLVLTSSHTASDIIAQLIEQVNETNKAIASINEAVETGLPQSHWL